MMFHNTRKIKKTRKPHRCEMCGKIIDKGSEAAYSVGSWDGDFYSQHEHVECHESGLAYAQITNRWGDEYVFFANECQSDLDQDWIKKEYPIVAERLGLNELDEDDE